MTASLAAEDQLAIQSVINRFFRCLDLSDVDQAGRLFTEGAKMDLGRPGVPPVLGRDAIIADMRKRPAGRVTRHLVTSIIVTPVATDRATASVVNAIHAGPDDNSKVREEIGASDTDLVLIKESDGNWRFDDMKRTIIFKPQR